MIVLLASCRLYSDYLYFGIANKSAEDFHEKVSESLQLFEGCLTEYTTRSCVYNTTVNNVMPVSGPSSAGYALKAAELNQHTHWDMNPLVQQVDPIFPLMLKIEPPHGNTLTVSSFIFHPVILFTCLISFTQLWLLKIQY